jgi:hypothetical protein
MVMSRMIGAVTIIFASLLDCQVGLSIWLYIYYTYSKLRLTCLHDVERQDLALFLGTVFLEMRPWWSVVQLRALDLH